MFRLPARRRFYINNITKRQNSSSTYIRKTFIDFFTENYDHKHVKSSSVMPLCDPSVPFVNAGMNQFKGVFLGKMNPPNSRVVNSQKCIRVGGKHNDLEIVGTDGTHHTFFEMLGNWSFGDYYKKEACLMAWDLLLGPYRLKPEKLLVTYFSGDAVIGLKEDTECRDIWRDIGVPKDHIIGHGSKENFWEMGSTGPCGPCTEIHYINEDGSLTELWNIVFIQCNRENETTVKGLRTQHVDTGMGLERMAALLQNVPSNYDTDLFRPIIKCIEENSKNVSPYSGSYDNNTDIAYRRLADHARMVSICLADGVFPSSNLNLKQIMRKAFKISTDIFQNPLLLPKLYHQVGLILGEPYPELLKREKDAILVLEQEEASYAKLRSKMGKKWKDLAIKYPEVEMLGDVELAGFYQGYTELKETMSITNSIEIPGELVFKLYDTHGFQEDIIDKIANINKYTIDKKTFWKLLKEHRSRHKKSFKAQTSLNTNIEKSLENIPKNKFTNDLPKYEYTIENNEITFKPITSKILGIMDETGDWIDLLEPTNNVPYYLVTEDTNFYCEEGGQSGDTGTIETKSKLTFRVGSAFKIKNFVFHLGSFKNCGHGNFIDIDKEVILTIDNRVKRMRNHTGVHLLNAALRKVLKNSVVNQNGSKVLDNGLSLSLTVYGDKLTDSVVSDAQELIRKTINSNVPITTSILDNVQFSEIDDVVTVPGEVYPEVGLRLVHIPGKELQSKELCCGTHVPSTGFIEDFCITLVKGMNSNSPTIHAITGDTAKQARELFCRAKKLSQVIDLIEGDRLKQEASDIESELTRMCGSSGVPVAEYADCLTMLDNLLKSKVVHADVSLEAIAAVELSELDREAEINNSRLLVHFLRCSYLMNGESVSRALRTKVNAAAMFVGCASGILSIVCQVPKDMVTEDFTAEKWLRTVLPIFNSEMLPPKQGESIENIAEMRGTKVSLINCEQQVQDAMTMGNKYAAIYAPKRSQADKDKKQKVKSN